MPREMARQFDVILSEGRFQGRHDKHVGELGPIMHLPGALDPVAQPLWHQRPTQGLGHRVVDQKPVQWKLADAFGRDNSPARGPRPR